jgi:hypothetical protein
VGAWGAALAPFVLRLGLGLPQAVGRRHREVGCKWTVVWNMGAMHADARAVWRWRQRRVIGVLRAGLVAVAGVGWGGAGRRGVVCISGATDMELLLLQGLGNMGRAGGMPVV